MIVPLLLLLLLSLGCDMLNLVLRNGSIGPWRADIDGGGCVTVSGFVEDIFNLRHLRTRFKRLYDLTASV